jgi:molybdopterin/thiamine biosynthesis adenylyltransferase
LEPDDEIFSRERLAGYDPALMSQSTVLIVGAGALGQNTAMNLALSGVGEIRIVDRDRFEHHNRTRSPAYPTPEEQGRYGMDKARTVAAKLRRLMTAPQPVMRYANNWIQELGDGAFRGVSAVASCVDSQLARAYLSDKTRQHGLPFIEGGFEAEHVTLTSFPGFSGDLTLSSFPATSGNEARTAPCWRCSHQDIRGSFSCRNYAARAEAAGIIPAVQNAAAVLAGLQSEAVLLAIHPQLVTAQKARALNLNIRTWRIRIVKLTTDIKCPGIHRAIESPGIRLQTTADEPVGKLLEEISGHFGAPGQLKLPMKTHNKLIWNAPCTKCGAMAAVRGPEWKWRMSPLCSAHGGPFVALNGTELSAPANYPELTLRSNPEILRASCRQIGLPPLSLVEAAPGESASVFYDADSPSTFFEMPGSLQELYVLGDEQ